MMATAYGVSPPDAKELKRGQTLFLKEVLREGPAFHATHTHLRESS